LPSEFNLRINGDASGLIGSVKHSIAALTGLESKSNKVTKGLSTAFKTLAIIGTGGLGIQAIQRYGDILIDTKNRLGLVTDGTSELNYAMNDLFNISIATRSSFEATATVYSRVALATREMGKSAQDLNVFTTTLNQAMILSGTKAVEAGQALIQLSQGMASGALRGDELRSVLEQLPYVADLIADGLKVTRGELREMGRQGKITTDIVFDAITNGAVKVDAEFKKTKVSISQASNVFETSFLRSLDKLNKSIPIVESLASSLMVLADNVGVLGRALVVISLMGAGKKGIGGLSTMFAALAGRIKAVYVGTQQLIKVQDTLGVKIAESNKAIATAKQSASEGRVAGTAGQIAMQKNKQKPWLKKQKKRFDEIEQATGVTNKNVGKLNTGLARLSNRFPKLKKLGGVFMFISVAVSGLTSVILFLFTTLAGLAVLILAVAAAIFVVSGKIKVFEDASTGASISILDLFVTMVKNIDMVMPGLAGLKKMWEDLKEAWSDPDVNRAWLGGFIDGMNDGIVNLKIFTEHTVNLVTQLGLVFVGMFDGLWNIIKALFNKGLGFINTVLEYTGNKKIELFDVKSMSEVLAPGDIADDMHKARIAKLKGEFSTGQGDNIVTGLIEKTAAEMSAQEAKDRADQLNKIKSLYDDIIDKLYEERKLLRMSTREAEVQAFVIESTKEMNGQIIESLNQRIAAEFRINRAIGEQRALIESITNVEEERVRNQGYLVNGFKEGKITLDQYLTKAAELDDIFFQLPKTTNSVIEDFKKVNKELSQGTIENLVDSFVEAKRTSEEFLTSTKKQVAQEYLMGDILDSQKQARYEYLVTNLKITDAEKAYLIALYQENAVLTEQNRLKERQLGLEENRKTTIEDIGFLERDLVGDLLAYKQAQAQLAQGGITQDEVVAYYELGRAINSVNNELFYQKNSHNGIKLGLKDVYEQTKLTADSVANELVNAFGHAEDAMVEFFMTGKIGFKEMINAMISDLVRFATQKFIINSIVGGIGNFGSKDVQKIPGTTVTMENLPAVPGMASGGITSGGLTMVGERGPEIAAFPKNTRIMSYMDSMNAFGAASYSGNGAASPINITVNQNIESSGGGDAGDQDMLDKISAYTQKAIKESIRTELREQQRPRNMLNPGLTM
jgi:tape measure domain-containing protein